MLYRPFEVARRTFGTGGLPAHRGSIAVLICLASLVALGGCKGPEAGDGGIWFATPPAQEAGAGAGTGASSTATNTPAAVAATETAPLDVAVSTPSPGHVAPSPTPPIVPVDLDRIALGLEQVGAGFAQPVFVTHAGDGSGRIFVLEKTGSIRLLDGTLYLDISDQVLFYDLLTVQHELGLLGLAFHPDFERNGYFYVHYTDRNQDHVISRFTQGPNGSADPRSEKLLIVYDQPDVNFVGGMLTFGRDGYLYIGMGTGLEADPPQVVAQQLDNLYGKILRIDVDRGDPYAIPPDNPFIDTPGARPEVWAYGLRNPWRFAFDRVTNDLYIGGPGEFEREWIHFVAGGAAAGLNFGWPILEGSECWDASPLPCDTTGLELPILEYATYSDGNCVVIGGYVYRGPSHPELAGAYLYGDYCSGRIWAAARDESGAWDSMEMLDTDMLITSFGEDENGETYVTDGRGGIYRITAEPE